jgi:sirohydrochlorin cobaltochelatase
MSEPKDAPMKSAAFVYNDDGTVAWDKMWTNYCYLAREGGPPHRGTKLESKESDYGSQNYQDSVNEILRAIHLITLYKTSVEPGKIILHLHSKGMAKWFSDTINLENVECIQRGKEILLPVNDDFTLKEGVKNIVTVVGKAEHYWSLHKSPLGKLWIHITGKGF